MLLNVIGLLWVRQVHTSQVSSLSLLFFESSIAEYFERFRIADAQVVIDNVRSLADMRLRLRVLVGKLDSAFTFGDTEDLDANYNVATSWSFLRLLRGLRLTTSSDNCVKLESHCRA